jgi:hypothetical protein
MAFDVYEKILNADVADNGTFTFPYASGKEAADYVAGGAELYCAGLQALFEEDDDDFDVSYGASLITVTYKGSTTIPKTTRVQLQATRYTVTDHDGDDVFENVLTDQSVGTVTTAATTVVEEHGDSVDHVTKLTLTDFDIGDVGDSAALAIGAKFYTFPAGGIFVENISLDGTITCAGTGYAADTPEVGIGTLIGSGANATLGDVGATAENAWGPVVAGALDDTAIGAIKASDLYIATSGGLAHDLFLNAADTWANGTAGALLFTGVITIRWRKIT